MAITEVRSETDVRTIQANFAELDARNSLAPVADYAAGIEITQYNQLVRDENGEFWRVSGQVELPYVTTGAGIPEDDALVPVGDAVLRQDLANPDKGAAMVARGVVAVDSIADLLALPEGQRKEDLRYLVKGYYAGSDVGGGSFYWDAGSAREDNGITVFEVSGVATGRWMRHEVKRLSPEMAGGAGDGVTDNAAAFNAVTAALRDSGGGSIHLRDGVYLIGSGITTFGGINWYGPGWARCEVRNADAPSYVLSINPGDGGTPDPADNEKNIEITGIHFSGPLLELGFQEHRHVLNLNAVSDLHIHHCKISGFCGDGIYLGSSNMAGVERHNERVVIEHNLFDGINNDNRNGISVIDGVNVAIRDNHFMRCSRGNMPGSIDIEPDAYAFARIRDIHIERNIIVDDGGNVGSICLVLPLGNDDLTLPAQNINIRDNTILGANKGIRIGQKEDKSPTSIPNAITVSGNVVSGCKRPFQVYGIAGLELSDNTFSSCLLAGLLAYSTPETDCYDVRFHGNTIKNIGTDEQVGLSVHKVDRLSMADNVFDDNGNLAAPDATHINFADGTIKGVEITGNKFLSTTIGGTVYAALAAEMDNPDTIMVAGNTFDPINLGFRLEAYRTDVLSSATLGAFDSTTMPDSFPCGRSVAAVNGDTGAPSTYKRGTYITERYLSNSNSFRKWVIQWFYPANEGVDVSDIYFRKAEHESNTWGSWHKMTGTAV